MSQDKYEALRKAAEAVISEGGKAWFCNQQQFLLESVTGEYGQEWAPLPVTDMAHIAAASPDVILDLLAERDRLREALVCIANTKATPGENGWQHWSEQAREALSACVNLLRKTPKITRDMYVGKDRQSWGAQAKVVFDAALAALNQKDEK